MLTHTQEIDLILHYVRQQALAGYEARQRASIQKSKDWQLFDQRLQRYLPVLANELASVYGTNVAVLPMLEQ